MKQVTGIDVSDAPSYATILHAVEASRRYRSGGVGTSGKGSGSATLVKKLDTRPYKCPMPVMGCFRFMRYLWQQIWADHNARKLALFLMVNLAVMGLEIVVGRWTNSLGLLSDAGHMFFDCGALFMGLCASVTSRWFRDARINVFSGLLHGISLLLLGLSIFGESVHRLMNPVEVLTHGLLSTSIVGFAVNLVGILYFHEHASHGGCNTGDCSCQASSNANMQGVFLHILADALGSLSVIVSSLLIEYRGWAHADTICSLIIASFISLSAYPLIRSTWGNLKLYGKAPEKEAFEIDEFITLCTESSDSNQMYKVV